MYGRLWRHLPGGVTPRIAQRLLLFGLLLFAGVAALLVFVVFPAVEPHLPFDNVTIRR